MTLRYLLAAEQTVAGNAGLVETLVGRHDGVVVVILRELPEIQRLRIELPGHSAEGDQFILIQFHFRFSCRKHFCVEQQFFHGLDQILHSVLADFAVLHITVIVGRGIHIFHDDLQFFAGDGMELVFFPRWRRFRSCCLRASVAGTETDESYQYRRDIFQVTHMIIGLPTTR